MTIDECYEAKKQAEDAITEALSKFMRETDLLVEDVRISFIETNPIGSNKVRRAVSSVTLDVRL